MPGIARADRNETFDGNPKRKPLLVPRLRFGLVCWPMSDPG